MCVPILTVLVTLKTNSKLCFHKSLVNVYLSIFLFRILEVLYYVLCYYYVLYFLYYIIEYILDNLVVTITRGIVI